MFLLPAYGGVTAIMLCAAIVFGDKRVKLVPPCSVCVPPNNADASGSFQTSRGRTKLRPDYSIQVRRFSKRRRNLGAGCGLIALILCVTIFMTTRNKTFMMKAKRVGFRRFGRDRRLSPRGSRFPRLLSFSSTCLALPVACLLPVLHLDMLGP